MKYLEAKALHGGAQNKALTGAPENKGAGGGDADPLASVDFASGPARAAAHEAGLTADDFKRKRRGAEKGFTKDDVKRIAADRAADEETA